ncbi:unnamed protein product [Angiostrongylus costaricensis]|uniref:Cadherin domain-containing protein n=1 Tax=Angiostrongylus costaricensis TaxID=334426 RepID=A0A0R3PE40_ANGCS|nr:unnamed protein product [Angiostrongylus costaricensis]
MVQTAKIHVEVLSLSPTTHRGSTSTGTTTSSAVVFQETTPTDVFQRSTSSFTTTTTHETTKGIEMINTIASAVSTENSVAHQTAFSNSLSFTELSAGQLLAQASEASDKERLGSNSSHDFVSLPRQPILESHFKSSLSPNLADGLRTTQTTPFKELELIFEGVENNTLEIEKLLSKGDLLHGLALSVLSDSEGKRSPVNLSLDRSDLFDIRPKLLYPGSKAYLFAKGRPLDASTIPIKITAIAPGSTSTRELAFISVSRGQNFTENVEREDMSSVIEYDLFIPENAESGSIVGQIEDGESKRVVGPPGLFSLLGSDLILSCPDEGSCLDFEQQPTHYVLLVDAQGKRSSTAYVKINVLDVNDNRPRLQTSDHYIRLSHNRLVMPFIVQVRFYWIFACDS